MTFVIIKIALDAAPHKCTNRDSYNLTPLMLSFSTVINHNRIFNRSMFS